MLDPDQRALLLDALRPPAGMAVDRAVGTTFSLNLEALLLAPLSFALFDARLAEEGDHRIADPLSLLEAVRRHADHLDLFCQAGQIALPETFQPIVSSLEGSIHPCQAPNPHHIFHPKLWMLRFATPDRSQRTYRLLVLSRNLTFDQSWDTLVQLEGVPGRPNPGNRPLSELIAALPGSTIQPVPSERAAEIVRLAEELQTVEWELPEGVESVSFHPLGLTDAPPPPLAESDRLLVVSPFLSASRLAQLADAAPRCTVVSRPESFDRVPSPLLSRFERLLQLAPGAFTEDGTDAPPVEELAESSGASIDGLHAKLYIAERGESCTVFTGSTNATDAGFTGNVELLVGLSGPRRRLGVEAVLGPPHKPSNLARLLVEYRRDRTDPSEPPEAERVAVDLDRLGRDLAAVAFTVTVEETEEGGDQLRTVLTTDRALPAATGVSVRCWPITLRPETAAVDLTPGVPAEAAFLVSLTALTSFVAVELVAAASTGPVIHRVVVNAQLIGAPPDRLQRVLTAQLRSQEDVIRYLLLLLIDVAEVDPSQLADVVHHYSSAEHDPHPPLPQVPLFEAMVRALSRSPDALDHIHRLIRDLQRSEEGRRLLPDGIDHIWEPIWAARETLRA